MPQIHRLPLWHLPVKKGKEKQTKLELPPVFSHLVGLTHLENKLLTQDQDFLTHLFFV